jgi:hypothetical protein
LFIDFGSERNRTQPPEAYACHPSQHSRLRSGQSWFQANSGKKVYKNCISDEKAGCCGIPVTPAMVENFK